MIFWYSDSALNVSVEQGGWAFKTGDYESVFSNSSFCNHNKIIESLIA